LSCGNSALRSEPQTEALASLFTILSETVYHRVVMSSPSQKQTDRIAKGRFAPGNKLGVRFKPGQSGNPGGNHKGTPKITNAYARLLKMSPDEIANFQPQNGAEVIALRQFTEAIAGLAPLRYAQEITNRTDGPLVRKVQKEDIIQLQSERQRFEAAIDGLVEKRGCSRADAALALATVRPSFKKFIEESDNDPL
jgi:hypothetical protein